MHGSINNVCIFQPVSRVGGGDGLKGEVDKTFHLKRCATSKVGLLRGRQ